MPYTSDALRPGKMRHRIQFCNPGTAYDEAGGVSLAVTSPLATVWAEISAITGRDVLAAAQFSDIVTHAIRVRYNPLFAAKQQIYFQGPGNSVRIFQIEAIMLPKETNKMQILLVVEISDSSQQTALNAPTGLR